MSFEIENNDDFNISELNDYYIKYDDFFDLKNNNKFLLLEKIINKNLVNKECLKEFREYNKNKIEEIISKIKNGSVDYKKIKNYFENDNNKNEFKRRLEIILKFINDFEENKNLYNEIEQKINNINKIIEDLKIIEQKMKKYLKVSKKEEIKEIQDLIIEIESYNLDYYLIDQEQINKFLKQNEIEDLPLNLEKSNFFFKILYEGTKTNIKDEQEIIKVTNKKFKNLIDILTSNSFNNEYINYLNEIVNKLNEEQFKNLKEEIDNIINEKNEEKEKILDFLKCIWKKDLIYNLSIFFKLMLEKTYVKKTEFPSVNNLINKYLKSPKNINIIKVCIEFYKNYQIDLDENKYFEFFKSIKSIGDMNKFVYYLLNIEIQEIQTKLIEFESGDYVDYNYINDVFEKLIKFKTFLEDILSNINEDTKDIDIIKNLMNELTSSEEIRNDFKTIIYYFNLIKEEIIIK